MDITCIKQEQFDGDASELGDIVNVPDMDNIANVPDLDDIPDLVAISPIKIVSTCSKCLEEFSDANELEIHNIIHTNEKYCPLCKTPFQRRNDFLMHIKAHLKSKPHRCELCSKSFQTRQMLRIHTVVHTDERPFKCTKCTKSYKTISMLRYHEDTHLQAEDRNKRKFACQICKALFTTRSSLRRHFKRAHKQQTDISNCELCLMNFHSNDLYLSHVRNHHSDQINECKYCKRNYTSPLALKVHMEIKHSVNGNVPELNEIVDMPDLVYVDNKHSAIANVPAQDKIVDVPDQKVPMADKHFLNADVPDLVDLNNTIFENYEPATTKILSTCSKCPMKFSSTDELKIHDIIHTNEKYCPLCKKDFDRRNGFVMHVKTHLKVSKPHQYVQCQICNALFTRGSSLRRHLKLAHKQQAREILNTKNGKSLGNPNEITGKSLKKFTPSFKCDQCGRAFKTKKLLGKHKYRHKLNKKQFACSGCPRFFDTKENLYLHEFCHAKQGNAITCDVCCESFVKILSFRKHYLKLHKSKTKNDLNDSSSRGKQQELFRKSRIAAAENLRPDFDEQATCNEDLQTLVKSEEPESCVKVEEIDIKIENLY